MSTVSLPNVWVVRADGGKYTEACVKGGYMGLGWDLGDLSTVTDRETLRTMYKAAYPEETSNYVIGQQVGQHARFLREIKAGDYIITPATDTQWLRYGRVGTDPSYFYAEGSDGCPYRHRRRVEWAERTLNRSEFSFPFQYKIRSSLTVYSVELREEFLERIGELQPSPAGRQTDHDPQRTALGQILELNDKDFEELVKHLLSALGFEDPEVVGGSGDRGVDVKGTLNASGVARVDVRVQAKRYQLGSKVGVSDVLKLRQVIPTGEQGAVITTAGFHQKAYEAASEPGFARIGLINGSQLLDLLIEHWSDFPEEFRALLRLKPGLVLA